MMRCRYYEGTKSFSCGRYFGMKERLYRPNVAALLVTAEGKILVCERTGTPGAWQFPQGGIDPGESAQEAILREIMEETGYCPDNYTIETSGSGYRYDYPPEVLSFVCEKRKQPFVGQEQTYFLCRLKDDAPRPVLDQREFSQFKWIDPSEFDLAWLPSFKRDVYAAVLKDFFGV